MKTNARTIQKKDNFWTKLRDSSTIRTGITGFFVVSYGVCFLVHASNPVTEISDDDLRRIFTGELDDWKQVGGPEGAITVINRAKGYDIEHQHPVATIQLAGETLIELDQVTDLEPAPFHGEAPPTGIALVHFQHAVDAPELGTGAAGERYRLQPLDEGTPS